MTDKVRLLAKALHGAGIGCEGRYACASTHHVHTAAARAILSHCPPGIIITTTDELAKEIPESIGWLCESEEWWADYARMVGARLTCPHPEYAPVTDPDMPWRTEFRCVQCGSTRSNAAIERERQHEPIGSCAEGEG